MILRAWQPSPICQCNALQDPTRSLYAKCVSESSNLEMLLKYQHFLTSDLRQNTGTGQATHPRTNDDHVVIL